MFEDVAYMAFNICLWKFCLLTAWFLNLVLLAKHVHVEVVHS